MKNFKLLIICIGALLIWSCGTELLETENKHESSVNISQEDIHSKSRSADQSEICEYYVSTESALYTAGGSCVFNLQDILEEMISDCPDATAYWEVSFPNPLVPYVTVGPGETYINTINIQNCNDREYKRCNVIFSCEYIETDLCDFYAVRDLSPEAEDCEYAIFYNCDDDLLIDNFSNPINGHPLGDGICVYVVIISPGEEAEIYVTDDDDRSCGLVYECLK